MNQETTKIQTRLEYLRGELRAERLSWNELAELQRLAPHIKPDDVELLEAAGVPEFPKETTGKHTKTPWHLQNESCIASDGKFVAQTMVDDEDAGLKSLDQAHTDARFIVTACNNFEELVVMLGKAERALRWAAQESTGRVKAEIVGGWLYHADQAASLLSKIKGTK